MASFLRPRRGKKATAVAQLTASAPLKRGEIFFEVPDTGCGTGTGKIKMGDGTTAYASLPYFMEQPTVDYTNAVVAWTNTTAADSDPYSTNSTYAGNIVPSASLKTIFTNLKKLLLNYNSQLTSLNNDLEQNINQYCLATLDSTNSTTTLSSGVMAKQYLVPSQTDTYFSRSITGNGAGIKLQANAVYLISASLYISADSSSNAKIGRGIFIRTGSTSSSGTEIASSIEFSYDGTSKGFDGAVCISPFIYIPSTTTTLYLFARVSGSSGSVSPTNAMSFMHILKLKSQ